jgi:hypothetical protein
MTKNQPEVQTDPGRARGARTLPVRQKPPDLTFILGADEGILPQASLTLAVLAGEDVAVIRLFPLDLPALENRESLGRTAA